MNILRVLSLSALLIVLGAFMGCGGGNSNVQINGPVISAPKRFQNLEFTVSTDKAVWTFADHIVFHITMKNVGTQPITLMIQTCPLFDAVVQQGSQIVWTYSHDLFCLDEPPFSSSATINPGETGFTDIAWNQKDNNNRDAGTGQYTVTAWLYLIQVDQSSVSISQTQADYAPIPISFTLKSN